MLFAPMKTLLPALLWLSLAACTAPAPAGGGPRPLFNGENLEGWVAVNTAPSTWSVVDGMLHCSGKPTGELRTERMYQNFILELEWRHLHPGGNAGVFVWADDLTARGVPFHRSVEVQVLDHAYGNTRHYTTHGDIFPIHGASMTPVNGRGGSRAFPVELRSNPSPEWNHYRITCFEGAITLAVNGKVVTRGYDSSPRRGYICLESEGGVVDYRNITIQELPDTPIASAHVAVADRGYRTLYTGVDLEGWEGAAAGEVWRVEDWVLAFRPEEGAPPPPLSTRESFADFGFTLDVRVPGGWSSGELRLRGSERAAIPLDPRHPALAGRFTSGWNRLEGSVVGNELSLSLNGHLLLLHRPIPGLPPEGPLVLAPGSGMDFANLFVREL